MQTFSVDNSRIVRIMAVMVISTITITILMVAKSFLIPLAWSLVIAIASFRMLNRIEEKYSIKRLASSLIFVALIIIGIILLFYFFYSEVVGVVKGIPHFREKLLMAIQNLTGSLEDLGIHVPVIDQTQVHAWVTGHLELISRTLVAFGKSIGNVFLVAVYLFFILYYRDNFLYYLKLKVKSDGEFASLKNRGEEEIGVIRGFLLGLFSLTAIMATMLYLIFILIGLKFALFFAVFVAILSLLPYIGNPIGMAVVVLFALVSNDGLVVPILALAGMILTNIIKSSVIKPIIIGNKISLNAFVIFLSVILGGLIWGVSGMILFMPFAGIAKILLDSQESTRPLAVLLGTLPKDAFKSGKSQSPPR